MKKLIELGNLYASKSDWKDFALVKFCLFSMGLLIGINAPKKHQKTVTVLSALVFAVTYVLAHTFRLPEACYMTVRAVSAVCFVIFLMWLYLLQILPEPA